MDLFLSTTQRRTGLVAALYERLREAIDEGRLRPGDAVPPSRALARQLSISRHSVTTAYGFLVAEGFLVGSSGGGTRVAPALEGLRSLGRRPPHRLPRVGEPAAAPPLLDARLGFPDASLFPVADWKEQVGRALRARGEERDGDSAGLPQLRDAVAAWVHGSRGVRARAEAVLVTSGAQQGFDLILRVLTRPSDAVVVEDPGYAPFVALARSHGLRVLPVPVDSNGLDTSRLPRTAKLVYVTPSHQFPLGAVLSLQRRLQLLEWARRVGALVIEDDYDSEFRYRGRPLEPLQRLAPEQVLYVGTFSKVLSPALRLGFVVAPEPLVARLATARRLVDGHSPLLTQRALARFLHDGMMARHLKRARQAYQARHDLVVRWLEGPGRSVGTAFAVGAGLHLALALRDDLDEAVLIDRARARGVLLEGLSKWATRVEVNGLALGFGGVGADQLPRVLECLERAAKRR